MGSVSFYHRRCRPSSRVFSQGLPPCSAFLVATFRFERRLQLSESGERRLDLLVFTVTTGILRRTAVRAEPRAIFITEGLERHRERDHLSEEIVETDHGPAVRADLEILPEAHPVLRQPSLSFGIGRLATERLEHQAIGIAKRMRIALAASAALETDLTLEIPLDHDVVGDPRSLERESERRLGDDRVVALDGTPVAELVCTPFRTWLTGKRTVTATIRRDGETVEVVLGVRRTFEEPSVAAR